MGNTDSNNSKESEVKRKRVKKGIKSIPKGYVVNSINIETPQNKLKKA